MSKSDKVRASRDGDQFHYAWAARRCLQLLPINAELKAITIEGPSPQELSTSEGAHPAEQLIDVAEYYGSEDLNEASRIRYIQLKHSTETPDDPWPPSGLEKTVSGFAERYTSIKDEHGQEVADRLQFIFLSNRPINEKVLDAINDLSTGSSARHKATSDKIATYTGLTGDDLASFCKCLSLEGDHSGLRQLRSLLTQDTSAYLPGADCDAPIQLRELITQKALSESATNPTILRTDVLRVLGTNEAELFPAQCKVAIPANLVPRTQQSAVAEQIYAAGNAPVLIHAEGGIGKSVISTQIGPTLPHGSCAIVYDCFGNGQYRQASSFRHRHKDALVQIANELSARGLCDLLIPHHSADPTSYLRAFIHRVNQAALRIRDSHNNAVLCIIIDAADNAQMAAAEYEGTRSFAFDLIRERLPDGVRLVFLARTHRQELLKPPSNVIRIGITPFSFAESEIHLKQSFSEATRTDVEEFHHLSSQNPRVQALALSQGLPLHETLRSLGPNPTTVEDAISDLLEQSLTRLKDDLGRNECDQIERICSAMAALRPMIPLDVLSKVTGSTVAAIRTFAYGMGRALLVSGDTIQFCDEPTETWFRDTFAPASEQYADLVTALKPLASDSPYAASSLPQLMLEAGLLNELVDLALSSTALPTANPVQARDIELQRLQFSLKATLRMKRYGNAAKIALKAGGETAGESRQASLLQQNTDLVSIFLDDNAVQDLVQRRIFNDTAWMGSHHVYEAGLLSGKESLRGSAKSRLRMAGEWLRSFFRQPDRNDQGLPHRGVQDDDILEAATTHLNLRGSEACAAELRRWKPRSVSFNVGLKLATRLAEQGKYTSLANLSQAAGNDIYLSLGICLAMQSSLLLPPAPVIERTLRFLTRFKPDLGVSRSPGSPDLGLRAISALVTSALLHNTSTSAELVDLLEHYLPDDPPWDIGSRFCNDRAHQMKPFCLRAAITGAPLKLEDLAHAKLREELKSTHSHSESQSVREFRQSIGCLLPWVQLWADSIVSRLTTDALQDRFDDAKSKSNQALNHIYHGQSDWLISDIVAIWNEILIRGDIRDKAICEGPSEWLKQKNRQLSLPAMIDVCRKAAHSDHYRAKAFELVSQAAELIHGIREHAEQKSEDYVNLARAILPASTREAEACFNLAIQVASKIGDENLSRWHALTELAEHAANHQPPNPELAYRMARCAELTYEYVERDKYFDWDATIDAVAALSPASILATISRWHDRNFGRRDRILRLATSFLSKHSSVDPMDLFPLVCFGGQRNVPQLVNGALRHNASAERKVASNHLYWYMLHSDERSSQWRLLNETDKQHFIGIPDAEIRLAWTKFIEDKQKDDTNRYQHSNRKESDRDWDPVFQGLDLSRPEGIAEAYRRFRATEPPFYGDQFFTEAFLRMPTGREAIFISSAVQITHFSTYEYKDLLGSIPDHCFQQLAFRPALSTAIKTLCARFCHDIQCNRYYETMPLDSIAQRLGLDSTFISNETLEALGHSPQELDTERCFTLVGLLAPLLTGDDSTDALTYGLDLLEREAEDDFADGPWSADLALPDSIEEAVAGYIWSQLGSPYSGVRWEAAHAARLICAIGLDSILDRLVALIDECEHRPFCDSGLEFYNLHAQQWLLIALSRAAIDHPSTVARHAEVLRDLAFASRPHVLLQEMAKNAMLSLLKTGHLSDADDLEAQLRALNTSPHEVVETTSYSYHSKADEDDTRGDHIYFDMDLERNWFDQLGRCFGKSRGAVRDLVENSLLSEFGISGNWPADQRHKRRLFPDRATMFSHYSYPRVDDHQFYTSYHALMFAAGRLLMTTPVHKDPDEERDRFYEWIRDHGLTRSDGRWLSDRRDPYPMVWPDWKNREDSQEWPFSLAKFDFDAALFCNSENHFALWGDWVHIRGNRKQSVSVRSGLVSPTRSRALLCALQCAQNPHDYRIPDSEDDLQIADGDFVLKGWVRTGEISSGIDEFDPWAAKIQYPPPAPDTSVIQDLGIHEKSDGRRWCFDESDDIALSSETWKRTHPDDDEDAEQEEGCQLIGSMPFITQLLKKTGMHMIIKVEISRRHTHDRWDRSDEKTEYLWPSARLFLIRDGGQIESL